MTFEDKKLDSANAVITATSDNLETKIEQIAKNISKDIKIAGFRKGKVPVTKVKDMYMDKILDDVRQQVLNEFITRGVKDLKLEQAQLVGDPFVLEFNEKDNVITTKIRLGLTPEINLANIEKLVPPTKITEPSKEEIKARLENIANDRAVFVPTTSKTAKLKSGEKATIDFKGFLDDKAFENGSAENYDLIIGSKSFVGDFEEQLIDMKIDETKTIEVKFPKEYGAENLAGKLVKFEVRLKKISQKTTKTIDDAFAQEVLNKADATLNELEELIKIQLSNEAKAKVFESVKSTLADNLVKDIKFDIPTNILEQEIDIMLRMNFHNFSEEEKQAISTSKEAADKKRAEYTDSAIHAVKLTFIVDKIAKMNKIDVNEQEMLQTLYYEAMMSGQNPQEAIEYYKNNNLLPSVRMAIIENKVFNFLLESKVEISGTTKKITAKTKETKEEKEIKTSKEAKPKASKETPLKKPAAKKATKTKEDK